MKTSRHRLLAGALLALVPSLLFPFVASGEESPWRLSFDARSGLSVHYEGVPVIRQSTLAIVSPGWTPVLYNQQHVAPEVEPFDGTGGPGLRVRGENDVFAATYELEALEENRFHLSFEGELKKEAPARIELAVYFNANLISGLPYRGQSPAGEVTGRVPAFPQSIDQHANDLLPSFECLEFDSRLGKLRLEAEAGNERVMFFDARRDPQPWARRAPIFWTGLGSPSRPLTYGQPARFELEFSIQTPAEKPAAETTLTPPATPTPLAQSPRERPVTIIPTPKSARFEGKGFTLSPDTRWTIRQSDDDPRLEATLVSLLERYDLSLEGTVEPEHGLVEILVGEPNRLPVLADSAWLTNPEGYRLSSGPDGIAILSASEQGAYYGLQTLAQLVRPAATGAFCHPAVIEDWPSMKFRGAHWFPSASGVPFHEKLIERIMAAYKMNNVVIQCEAAVWESHPKIAGPNSITKPDLQRLVDLSRRHFINPIPLVNVPGHAGWIFRNGQNTHFVEDPGLHYAYCVNHPESFAFIQDIMQEAIEIFQPAFFHLGHDEVTLKGQFPHPDCPRCQGETATELVLKHMHRLNDWLAERDVGMMVWGDMMIAKEEVPDTAAFAADREEANVWRSNLPEDVVVTDWHYYAGKEYPSLALFHEAGHPTIASTWYQPENIYHFAQEALRQNSLGLLQTTWAGFFPDEEVLKSWFAQFSAFILAAEYAWSGRSDPPSALQFEPGDVFTRSYYGTGNGELPGRLIDISKAARTPREGWLELGEDWDLAALPAGKTRLNDVLFTIPENLVVLGHRLAPESAWQRVTFEIGAPARAIALLNTAVFDTPGGTIPARLIVTYNDGSTVQTDLVMGKTTAHWGEGASVLGAPVAWKTTSPAETPIALRTTRWANPHPDKTIARLSLEAVAPEQAWALAGLTLLE